MMVKFIGRILGSIVFVWLLICVAVFALQDGMIFHNVSDERSREFLQGRQGFTEIAFTTESGRTYHGMMYHASDEIAPLIIYFGGNGEVSHRHMRVREMSGQWEYFSGHHYLFIDYRGYGLNDGRPNYRNMYEQALFVFDFAASLPNVDETQIVVMGFSLGTSPAVHLAASRPVAGLIVVAPFANGYDLFNNVIPMFRGPMRFLVRQKFPSDEYAPYVTSPVLVIASHRDEIVPFSSSEQLAGLFSGEVDFMTLYHARHNDIFQSNHVFDRIKSFLESL